MRDDPMVGSWRGYTKMDGLQESVVIVTLPRDRGLALGEAEGTGDRSKPGSSVLSPT
jgi:hypothetical protein